jgi:hypothetical protein
MLLQVTLEALLKFHRQTQLKTQVLSLFDHKHPRFFRLCQRHDTSGYTGGAAQIQHVNEINGKSRPNPTTNNRDSSGYAGGTAQIPYVNTINDKSHPNLTTNIHNLSGYSRGAAQIP